MKKKGLHRDGYFTREELAHRWRCHKSWICHLDRAGVVRADPRPTELDAYYYPESDILSLEAQGYYGHSQRKKMNSVVYLQHLAFAMFDGGRDLRYVMRELGLTIDAVDALYKHYRENNLERRYRKNALAEAAKIDDE